MSEFSKIPKFKAMQKYQLHFYNQQQSKIKFFISIYKSMKNMQYLGINLIKDVQELILKTTNCC